MPIVLYPLLWHRNNRQNYIILKCNTCNMVVIGFKFLLNKMTWNWIRKFWQSLYGFWHSLSKSKGCELFGGCMYCRQQEGCSFSVRGVVTQQIPSCQHSKDVNWKIDTKRSNFFLHPPWFFWELFQGGVGGYKKVLCIHPLNFARGMVHPHSACLCFYRYANVE